MEMFGKTLCITFDELVRSGIMSKSNFDKHVRERKFQVLQKGGNGRKVLVAYETLSDALRSVVEKKLPDIKKQLKKGQINPMNIRLKSDDKAVEFYKTYTPKISIDRQKEYVLNAKVMNAMIVQETGLQNKHSEYGYTQYRHFLMRGASQVFQPYATEKRIPPDRKVQGLQEAGLRGAGKRYYRQPKRPQDRPPRGTYPAAVEAEQVSGIYRHGDIRRVQPYCGGT